MTHEPATIAAKMATDEIMSYMWHRWGCTTDIVSWHITKQVTGVADITFSDETVLSFQTFHSQISVDPALLRAEDLILGSTKFMDRYIEPVADMYAHAMEAALYRGVLVTQEIKDADPPTAPYHWDVVYRWRRLPVNIQTYIRSGALQLKFVMVLGVGT